MFNDIIKKLTSLIDKINGDGCLYSYQKPPACDKKCNQSAVSHADCNCKMPSSPSAFNSPALSKRNSIDANFIITSPKTPTEGSGGESKARTPREPSMNSLSVLQHRRSLSENVIPFPKHTTPSDKARCHLINRQMSGRAITELSTECPIILCPNMTLRKVAETMFLKDPQYKPRMGDSTTAKSNPFTALAQLKGVKKILGANPTTYTAGAGDLFSSCFEMSSSPFLKDSTMFQSFHKNGIQSEGIPKSLPSSPKALQKNYAKIDKSILKTTKNGESSFLKKDAMQTTEPITSPKEPKHSNGLELDVLKSTGTIKKYKANSLYSHPLFKCNDGRTEDAFDNPKILARRGSSESGFFSCLNDDDFAKPSTFNFERHTDYLSPMCRCCKYSMNCTNEDGLQMSNSNDTSNGFLVMDDRSSTTLSSLRSLDDFELFDKPRQFDSCRHPNMLHHNDNDTLSIDMGLINRLSLDSEINSIIQKNQFANQLLYCKNRTSSIYTDSSDDISSLAGSDSLLWDDRISSYTTSIPNTRSAQIAKIVEYFERKGQSFTPSFNVPDSFKSPPTTSERRDLSSISTDCFPSQTSEYCRQHGNIIPVADRKFMDFKTAREYETFCMELERRPTQPRITVCDGAVKSKLQIFDKLNNKRNN